MKLEFKTETRLQDKNTLTVKWVLLNEEIADQCFHGMDFELNGKSISEIISEYEATAKQAIFDVIDAKFPNLYILEV